MNNFLKNNIILAYFISILFNLNNFSSNRLKKIRHQLKNSSNKINFINNTIEKITNTKYLTNNIKQITSKESKSYIPKITMSEETISSYEKILLKQYIYSNFFLNTPKAKYNLNKIWKESINSYELSLLSAILNID